MTRYDLDHAVQGEGVAGTGVGAATGFSGSATWLRGTATNADVQPSDTLVVASSEGTQVLPVQSVRIVDGNCEPEQVTYTAEFRQSRAVSLGFRVETGLAADVAGTVAVTSDVVVPASLSGLQITVATTTLLQIDTGVDAPDGCGFEVRRSDAHFGSSSTADLVLQSPVRSFVIPRAAFTERFFVRMYDNAVPAKYSAVSSVVLTSLPLASV